MSIAKELPKQEIPLVVEGEIEGFGRWTLDENGLLDIIGSGKMPDWKWICFNSDTNRHDTTTPWDAIREKITAVRIAPSITSIGDHAFYHCKNLISIIIPDSITCIGDWTFSDCSGLTSIMIPNGCTSIGDCAFYGCTSLTSITIPNSIIHIGDFTFSKCRRLTDIAIPDSVTDMDDKRMKCILRSLFAELSDQETWKLSQELSRQLEVKPLFQVLHDYLPDADHRDAASKMAAAVDDMYQELEQRDTGEALALAAARYILNQEERENPYDLGLSAVDLVEGRRLFDVMKDRSLAQSEKASAFIAYYSVFLRKSTLMEIETLKEAVQKLLNIN